MSFHMSLSGLTDMSSLSRLRVTRIFSLRYEGVETTLWVVYIFSGAVILTLVQGIVTRFTFKTFPQTLVWVLLDISSIYSELPTLYHRVAWYSLLNQTLKQGRRRWSNLPHKSKILKLQSFQDLTLRRARYVKCISLLAKRRLNNLPNLCS